MGKANIKPIGGNILVKPVSMERTTESGLVLPDTVDKEKPQQGEVVALGTGRILENGTKVEFNVKVGDKVLFKKYSPDEIEVNGEEYLIMSEEAVLGVIS